MSAAMWETLKADGSYGPDTASVVRYAKFHVLGYSDKQATGDTLYADELASIIRAGTDARQAIHSFKTGVGGHAA